MPGRKTKQKPRAKVTQPALSRERILEAGLHLLEQSPGAELSMRVLAQELRTAPMSLYRHVRNRDDLLEGINRLALESLHFEVPTHGDWKPRARIWMHSLRRELHAQPAVAPLLRLRGSLSPTLFQVLDALVSVMLDAGFERREAALACREVAWFTMSFVTNEIRNQSSAQEATGLTGVGPVSFEVLSTEDLPDTPHLSALLPEFADIEIDEIFAAAADHLLDGLSGALDAKSPTRRVNSAGEG